MYTIRVLVIIVFFLGLIGCQRLAKKDAPVTADMALKPEEKATTAPAAMVPKPEEKAAPTPTAMAPKPEEKVTPAPAAMVQKPEESSVPIADKKEKTVLADSQKKIGGKAATVPKPEEKTAPAPAAAIAPKPEEKAAPVIVNMVQKPEKPTIRAATVQIPEEESVLESGSIKKFEEAAKSWESDKRKYHLLEDDTHPWDKLYYQMRTTINRSSDEQELDPKAPQ